MEKRKPIVGYAVDFPLYFGWIKSRMHRFRVWKLQKGDVLTVGNFESYGEGWVVNECRGGVDYWCDYDIDNPKVEEWIAAYREHEPNEYITTEVYKFYATD